MNSLWNLCKINVYFVKWLKGKRLNTFKEKNRILSFRKPSFVFVVVDSSFCFLINDIEAYFTFYHVIGLADLPSLPLTTCVVWHVRVN